MPMRPIRSPIAMRFALSFGAISWVTVATGAKLPPWLGRSIMFSKPWWSRLKQTSLIMLMRVAGADVKAAREGHMVDTATGADHWGDERLPHLLREPLRQRLTHEGVGG